MPKHILADTSCLILLEKIERISWLPALFGTIVVVSEVADEYGGALPGWIEVKALTGRARLMAFLADNLGKGEAASIALALELEDPLLILDDQRARKLAASLHLTFTGTTGILLVAKKRGLCPLLKPELDALINAGMWLASPLYHKLLDLAGEGPGNQ